MSPGLRRRRRRWLRRGAGTAAAVFLVVVVIGVAAISAAVIASLSGTHGGGTYTSSNPSGSVSITSNENGGGDNSTPTAVEAKAGAVFLVRVIQPPGLSSLTGVTVEAGPIPSPNDVAITPGGPTIDECVHEVPSGSSVGANGAVVLSHGATTTFAPCPLKDYVTNSTGWASIATNATSGWYFIKAGNVNEWNDVVVGVLANNTVSMAVPLPSGNITVPAGAGLCEMGGGPMKNGTPTCTVVPGTPVLWPQTTMVWPCGMGLPSGSNETAQGFHSGYYVAYAFASLSNGTKVALPPDYCTVGSP